MTKKLRENFFFILTTNIFTISLCFILYLINDGYMSDSPISNDAIHIAVPSIIICLLLFIGAIIYCYIGQKDIVINNNISGNNTIPLEFTSDKIEAMRQQYQQDLVRIDTARMNAIKKYSYEVLYPYLNDNELENLILNIKMYGLPDCNLREIFTDGTLTTLDLNHYIWNIGVRLGWSGQKKAFFLKQAFPFEYCEVDIETIRRNLRKKGKCIIEIDIPDENSFAFHNDQKKSLFTAYTESE